MTDQYPGRAAALRVLLADDLSPAALRAAAFVAGVAWPQGTIVRVVSSPVGIGQGFSSFAALSEARAKIRAVSDTIAAAHERAAADLVDAGLVVESKIVHGRPERALPAEAERFGADLVVVGARDQAPLSATLLGSVSRAVVESAPSSVLVARASAVSRVLLAVDGSEASRFAASVVASWPLFANLRTLVLGVGEAPLRHGGTLYDEADWRTAFARTISEATTELGALVDVVVEQLSASGRKVEREIRLGDAGTEVVGAARDWAADLVVIGAEAQPFLHRVLLGSVARKVLDGVRSSVLVARPRPGTTGD